MTLVERILLACSVRDLHPPGSYAYNRWHAHANYLDVRRELQHLFWLDDEGKAKRAAVERMNAHIQAQVAEGTWQTPKICTCPDAGQRGHALTCPLKVAADQVTV
jgi:hypothetical protein